MTKGFFSTALACGITAVILGGCARSTQDIRIRVSPRTVTVDQPPFVATGDRVRVQVIDSTFSNRYVARDSAGTLIGMDRAPLFGETALKTISVGFPFSRVLPSDPAPDANKGLTPSFLDGGPMRGPGPRRAAATALAELSAAVAEMNLRARRMALRLDTLRDRVRGDPAERARLGLLSDLSWVPAARTVANDSTPARLQHLIETLGSARPAGYIFPDSFYSVRQEAERYGRRVDALRLVMPVEQLAGLADTSSVPQLLVNLATDVAAYDATQPQRERAERTLAMMVLTPAEQAVFKAISPLVPRPRQFLVLGMDLTSILVSGDTLQTRIDEVRNVVADVNRSTSRVAGAMTLLPRWTKNPDPDTVITRVYPSESDVRIVVLRRDRFAPWTATPGASSAAPKPAAAQSTQTSTATATTVTTVTTITPAGGGDSKTGDSNKAQTTTPAPTSFTTLTPPAGNDTVAVLSIPVIQRYRFHLGVGMVYSFLKTTAFETQADTVEGTPGVRLLRVGTDQDRLLPVAILSYTLLPLEGRFADRRARRYPWDNPSLQIQGGLGLQHPTEQLYAGIAAEFFPGLETGVGYNWAYVETSTRENGEFVPLSAGAATSKRWRRGTAVSVTLDATTFVKAFGGLLGL